MATITKLYAYANYGSGDVTVQMSVPASGCFGFWFNKDAPGFNSTYALLLSAYHTQTTIRIAGDDTQVWTGSGSTYCRLTFAAAI